MKVSSDVLQAYYSLNIIQKGVVNVATFFYKFVTHDEGLAFTKLVRFFRPLQKGDDPVADKADQIRQNSLPSTQSSLWKTKCDVAGIQSTGDLRTKIEGALGKRNIANQTILIERLIKDDTLSDSEFVGFFLKIKEDQDVWDLFSTLPLDFSGEELRVYVRQQILKIPVTSPKPNSTEKRAISSNPPIDHDIEQLKRIVSYLKKHFKEREDSVDYLKGIELTLDSYLDNGQYNLAITYISEFDFIPDIKFYEFNHGLKLLKQKTLHKAGRDKQDINIQFDKVEQDIINKMKPQSALDIFPLIKTISNPFLQRGLAQKLYDSYKNEGDEIKSALFFYESEREHNMIPIKR